MNTTQRIMLRTMLRELVNSTVDGVSGVWKVHSPTPGPTVGITIMTHGNEPSGLAAYRYFRYVYQLEKRLRKGTVYFVLNNPRAAYKYFSAKSEEGRKRARFIDVNMNRLPNNTFGNQNDRCYEVRRARTLRKIWKRFQYALDIHSTGQPTKPMIIKLARSGSHLISRFPIATIISNIDAVQAGKPASYFYGEKKATVYGVEVGGHEIGRSLSRAITCTKAFLASLKLISEPLSQRTQNQIEYKVFGSVWFANESYELVRPMRNFERVSKGQLIARGDGEPIIIPADGCTLMVPKGRKKPSIKEEVMFITRPPKVLGY